MLEINGWFFVQLINFLLLVAVLNIILYKPFLKLFKEREDSTKGALKGAGEMNEKREELMSRIDEKLIDARNKAKGIFEGLSNEGIEVQKDALEKVHNEAVEINRKAKDELDTAVEKARAGLKSDVENISKKIVEKLIG